jgi:poly(3-hydroxybutyrate) depolymerase
MYGDYALQDIQQKSLKALFEPVAAGLKMLSGSARLFGLAALGRNLSATGEMCDRAVKSYDKPAFNLPFTRILGEKVAITEEITLRKPYCNLLHFARDTDRHDPKVLLGAPMAGHYATLLRGTVEALLPHHDVYVTDWVNARDVPLEHGGFSLDDYAAYIQDMLHYLGPETHVIAVCQPTVPVLAAVSQMAANDDPDQPLSMTLMGGPIDTRANPTEVTRFAEEHDMQWFERNALSNVPFGYQGFGQVVYPGFKQLTGFMAMNLGRHIRSAWDMFKHLCAGNIESADRIKAFYNQYRAVMDIAAQFYLETVDQVFKRHLLPKGEMMLNNQRVDPSKITRTALFTVEGEKDDISAPEQTAAAHKLCNNLSNDKKFHYLQPGAGHYGIFEGRRWRNEIAPRITGFIRQQGVDNGLKYSAISADSRLMPSIFRPEAGALTNPFPAP